MSVELTVVFIRHGESENNVLNHKLGPEGEKLFDTQRVADASLTARGIEQANIVASRVSKEFPNTRLVLTSYMHRSLRTADAVHTALVMGQTGSDCLVRVHRDLHEIGGHYTNTPEGKKVGSPGRTSSDVQEEFPHFQLMADEGCENGWWKSTTKEGSSSSTRRAEALVDMLAREAATGAAGPVVIITHGDFFRYCMRAMELRGILKGGLEKWSLRNTAMTALLMTGESDAETADVKWKSVKVLVRNCINHMDTVGFLPTTN
jgi:broad specificity phosphatase PhoE